MSRLGVVIPTFNRRENLLLALEALARQTERAFDVVVADDGSTDGTREAIEALVSGSCWRGRLRYINCGPRTVPRPGRARNLAVASLPTECNFFIMVDSDVLLAADAVARFGEAVRRHPGTVLIGLTEWMPPQPLARVRQVMRAGGLECLRAEVLAEPRRRMGWTIVGPEIRQRTHPELFSGESETRCTLRPDWALTSNSGYPMALFRQLGGFDESMTGYGYEDIELGVRVAAAVGDCVVCPGIWSLHIWHRKSHPQRAYLENQRNLDYVIRKHGPLHVIESKANWSLWWHYHRQRDGCLVQVDGSYYVLNRPRSHRLRLDSEEWRSRLGFNASEEIAEPADIDMAAMNDMGAAKLTIIDE